MLMKIFFFVRSKLKTDNAEEIKIYQRKALACTSVKDLWDSVEKA